jgi:hypothetical protein
MRRTRSPCCARAASGHATALPSPAMNARRLISIPARFLGSVSLRGVQGNGIAEFSVALFALLLAQLRRLAWCTKVVSYLRYCGRACRTAAIAVSDAKLPSHSLKLVEGCWSQPAALNSPAAPP